MISIEAAHSWGWWNFWLESDSMLVIQVFTNFHSVLSWLIQITWSNCLELIDIFDLNFLIHTRKEMLVLMV